MLFGHSSHKPRITVFFSSRRRHTRFDCDWSSDVCSSDLSVLSQDMAERLVHGQFTRAGKGPGGDAVPQTRNELQVWVHEHLKLPAPIETALLAAIDAVFTRHERLWQESKQEAIQALSAGFREQKAPVPTQP